MFAFRGRDEKGFLSTWGRGVKNADVIYGWTHPQHGQTVCSLVQRVVQSLGNYDAVWEILLKSGRNHFSEFDA